MAPIVVSTPRQPSGAGGDAQLVADQSHAPATTRAAADHNLVVRTNMAVAAAPRPSHPHPGHSTPAAVNGWAQPTIPSGGTAMRKLASPNRPARPHPGRGDHRRPWAATKAKQAAIHSAPPKAMPDP